MRGTLQKSLILVIFLLGCSSKETSTVASGGRVSPTYQGPPEADYCYDQQTYADFITVTGTAKYIRRKLYDNPVAAPTFEGLGSADTSHATLPAEERPIRAAEIRVTDASGAVVQCGMTDPTNGTFSVRLPRGNVNYTFSINSRSGNFEGNLGNIYMRASVLNRPEANQFYSLQSSVNAQANRALGTITATATTSGNLLGGAFNILDQIFQANVYLRTKAGGCGANCTAVTLTAPVPKVSAYWEKGFNPNDYFGEGNGGLSFYLPGYSRLFILGGISGDIDSDDTDHFDNSVILHEYGHFLEDAMFRSDSPGGSHNGNAVIDPRLAWSEGWGNFIQAAVQNHEGTMTNPRYYDTSGNVDGDPDLFFQVNLETYIAGQDQPAFTGEGIFREFSVTRLLWDAIDTNGDISNGATDNRSDEFDEIWSALTKPTNHSFKTTGYAFLNIGHLHLFQNAIGGFTDWTDIVQNNFQVSDTSEYAQYVSTSGTCDNMAPLNHDYTINPNGASMIQPSTSNLSRDQDFYHIRVASSGTYTIQLSYRDADGADSGEDGNGAVNVVEADLDLVLYNEDAILNSASDMVGVSDALPDDNVATSQTESITVTLTAGVNYLLNVRGFVGSDHGVSYWRAENTHYSIKIGGADLCPDSL